MYHFFITYTPWILATNSVIAMVKNGNKDRTGWLMYGIGQVGRIVWSYYAGQYYLILTSGAYLILAIRNYRKRAKLD